jgi:ATP-dependent Clp protease ATP-binding subunit ClpB
LLRKTIRPEFLNRIDETIMFTPLSREDVKDIVKIQFNRIVKRMGNQDLKIEISDEAVNWLATVGYDPQYGARPVNRLLQKYVLNELSKKILAGEVSINKTIQIIMEEDELRFRDKQ